MGKHFDESKPLWITGADDAVIGTIERCGQTPLVVYDYEKLCAHFERDGMTEDDAVEWISFNVEGAWMGQGTPAILIRGDADDVRERLECE